MFRIPLMKPFVNQAVKDKVCAVLDSGYLTEGPMTRALEQAFQEFTGCKRALAVTSATTGLEMALRCLGVGAGDEVIVPDFTYPATADAVAIVGATAVLVDVDPNTFLIDYDALAKAITPRTKAIMPVHVHGCPADLTEIGAIAAKHGLILLEDAAQAHGATYDGKPVGTFGRGAGFSLQSSKNLSAGEGGVYVTNEDALLERANQIRNFAQNLVASDAKHYDLSRPLDGHRGLQSLGVGSMYRGNEMMAAFARSQLRRLPEKTARAQANAARLAKALNELPGVSAPVVPTNRTSVFHKYRVWLDGQKAGVDLPPEKLRDATIKALRAEGCEVVLWQGEPLPSFPLFREMKGFGKGFPFSASDGARLRANYEADYPVTKKLLASSIVLFSQTCPLIAQSAETVDRYAEAFRKVWEHRKDLVQLAG